MIFYQLIWNSEVVYWIVYWIYWIVGISECEYFYLGDDTASMAEVLVRARALGVILINVLYLETLGHTLLRTVMDNCLLHFHTLNGDTMSQDDILNGILDSLV